MAGSPIELSYLNGNFTLTLKGEEWDAKRDDRGIVIYCQGTEIVVEEKKSAENVFGSGLNHVKTFDW